MDGRLKMGRSLTAQNESLPVMDVDLDNDSTISITGDWTTLTTVINETGKFAWSYIRLSNVTAENYDFKLTVDGVVIWDYTEAVLGNTPLMGANTSESPLFMCKSSFKLEVKSTTDVNSTITVDLRPIL